MTSMLTFRLQKDEVDGLEAVNSHQLDRLLDVTAAWNNQRQQLTRQLQMTMLLLNTVNHIMPGTIRPGNYKENRL